MWWIIYSDWFRMCGASYEFYCWSFLAFLFFCWLACRFSCFLFCLIWFLAWQSLSAWSRASFIVLFVSSTLRLPLVLKVTKVFSVFSFIWCCVICMQSDRWSVRTLTMFLSAVLMHSFHFCWNLGSLLSAILALFVCKVWPEVCHGPLLCSEHPCGSAFYPIC